MDRSEVEVTHTGGRTEHANRSAVGRSAALTLGQLALDLAFVSTSSWDPERGVTTPSAPEVEIKRAAIESASRAVLLAG